MTLFVTAADWNKLIMCYLLPLQAGCSGGFDHRKQSGSCEPGTVDRTQEGNQVIFLSLNLFFLI
jgi:hypothetical protein